MPTRGAPLEALADVEVIGWLSERGPSWFLLVAKLPVSADSVQMLLLLLVSTLSVKLLVLCPVDLCCCQTAF